MKPALNSENSNCTPSAPVESSCHRKIRKSKTLALFNRKSTNFNRQVRSSSRKLLRLRKHLHLCLPSAVTMYRDGVGEPSKGKGGDIFDRKRINDALDKQLEKSSSVQDKSTLFSSAMNSGKNKVPEGIISFIIWGEIGEFFNCMSLI